MNRKILLIALRSDYGGGPKHIFDLIRQKNFQENLDIYIASPLDPPYGSFFQFYSKKHFPLRHRKFSIRELIGLMRFVKKEKIDLIHSHGRGGGVFSRLMKLLTRVQVFHTFHGLNYFEKSFFGSVRLFFDYIFSYITDLHICVGEGEAKSFQKYGLKGGVVVIPNGIDTEIFKWRPRKKKSEKILLGTLARLHPQKGLDVFVKLFKSFTVKKPLLAKNLKISIGGDGPEKEKLMEEIRKYELDSYIELKGFVEANEFLEDIDIYFSTARSEGLPLGVLEALSTGLPCLLSDISGHSEFKNNKLAEMFSLNNADDFCEGLSTLIKNKDLVEKKSKLGILFVKNEFSLEIMTSRTLKQYNERLMIPS